MRTRSPSYILADYLITAKNPDKKMVDLLAHYIEVDTLARLWDRTPPWRFRLERARYKAYREALDTWLLELHEVTGL